MAYKEVTQRTSTETTYFLYCSLKLNRVDGFKVF